MGTFHFDKKKEHEALAEKSLKAKDYATAFFHTSEAAKFTFALADQCDGKLKEAYLTNANDLVDIAAELKKKAQAAKSSIKDGDDKKSAYTKDGRESKDGESTRGQLGERPKERLADVSGMEAAKDEVRLSVIEPMNNPDKAKKYGLMLGGGLLLYGLPGTGKTFFAKAVAGELGLPFYVINSSDILDKYVGVAQERVQKIFDTARANPMSVVFIDETNGLLPSRGSDNVHQVSKDIAEIILKETDGIDSKAKNPFLLIGATNFPNNIDDAALSRFGTCIEVELPNETTRRFILKRELGSMEIATEDGALNYLVESTKDFSCRDLVNLSAYMRKMAAKEEVNAITLDFSKRNFKDDHIASADVAAAVAEFKMRIGKS